MNVVVHITEVELRGTPFNEYERVLHELIGYPPEPEEK
jgi:hypothetical protein